MRIPVLFVGECVGPAEEKESRPFAWASGKLLDHMLGHIEVHRDDVYLTHIVKQHPPKNRKPQTHETRAHLKCFEKELAHLNPRIVVYLGKPALHTFFPEVDLNTQHGDAFVHKGRYHVPLYHPAVSIYNKVLKGSLKQDFHKLKTLINQVSYEDNKKTA